MMIAIEQIVATALIIVGLSYLFHARLWSELVKNLFNQPFYLLFWSILFLPWGLVILWGHNLWVADWRVIITLLGWLWTLKCTFFLLFPHQGRFVLNWSETFLRRYLMLGGLITIALGAYLFIAQGLLSNI